VQLTGTYSTSNTYIPTVGFEKKSSSKHIIRIYPIHQVLYMLLSSQSSDALNDIAGNAMNPTFRGESRDARHEMIRFFATLQICTQHLQSPP
jgi:hypothetical protein